MVKNYGQKLTEVPYFKDFRLFVVSSAKKKPPVLPGEIESFSKNKNAELDARREYWRKNNPAV